MEDGGGQIKWRSGVEWAGDRWQPDRWSMVAARSTSALQNLVEHGLWSVVKIGIEFGALGNKIGGSI